ncbi:hypothetical protein GCM10009547_47340 [Sporichthya brevicatena]|uniref:Uncharacterized protein n=1 Tax=Sporichthya brevicatena TaxID=171442 RepID=A0ABN1HC14_9ACTN
MQIRADSARWRTQDLNVGSFGDRFAVALKGLSARLFHPVARLLRGRVVEIPHFRGGMSYEE